MKMSREMGEELSYRLSEKRTGTYTVMTPSRTGFKKKRWSRVGGQSSTEIEDAGWGITSLQDSRKEHERSFHTLAGGFGGGGEKGIRS